MAKDRQTPCKHYICEGNCAKGREGSHNHYCQRCSKYEPRAHIKHENLKKQKLDRIRKTERYDE